MTTLTLHSIKGGSGKSLIAVLSAYELSRRGKKVLLIDGDYNAPCLDSFFPPKGDENPFTSFLSGGSDLRQVIYKTGFTNLFVSYAPSPDLRQEVLRADVRTNGMYLKRILEGLEVAHDKLGFNTIIFDNSSGISLPAINQLSCSNKSIIVLRPVRYGIESTYFQLETIYRKLRYASISSPRNDIIVWNQVPQKVNDAAGSKLAEYLEYWSAQFNKAGIKLGTSIPYMDEVAVAMMGLGELDVPELARILHDHFSPLIDWIG